MLLKFGDVRRVGLCEDALHCFFLLVKHDGG